MYESIKKFVALVNRQKQRKQDVSLSIDEAEKLRTEITLLLLDLQEDKKNSTTVISGGKFK